MKRFRESLTESDLDKPVAELAAQAGLQGDVRLEELPCGGNNRVFRLYNGPRSYLLKRYFTHEIDPRERLDAEFSFSVFAWANGIRSLPRPIACSKENSLALYDFVEGSRASPHGITRPQVERAAAFFHALNVHKNSGSAKRLPSASEACFSLAEHLSLVQQRVAGLRDIEIHDPTDTAALDFVTAELGTAMKAVRGRITHLAERLRLDIDRKLQYPDRCISPSDFGFHNAIITGHDIRFIDFEYAGWDDPAKTLCDFFCQPEIPVPKKYAPYFLSKLSRTAADPLFLNQRVMLLYPLYIIKWCCIILNCFLPAGKERLRFSKRPGRQDRKKMQLDKARRYFLRRFRAPDLPLNQMRHPGPRRRQGTGAQDNRSPAP